MDAHEGTCPGFTAFGTVGVAGVSMLVCHDVLPAVRHAPVKKNQELLVLVPVKFSVNDWDRALGAIATSAMARTIR
jgi:hypothetical protein